MLQLRCGCSCSSVLSVQKCNEHERGIHHYCLLYTSPFQFGFFGGTFIGNPNYEELNKKLEEIGEKYGTNSTGMAIAWILRHPAKMQPIIGTVNPERIKTIANAADITITHDEWYELYRASGKTLP